MILVFILCAFGISFLLKESSGPFDILSKLRNKLLTNKYVGVFFYKLLSCYFCVGFWAGVISYFLLTPVESYNIPHLIAYGFAAAASTSIISTTLIFLIKDS